MPRWMLRFASMRARGAVGEAPRSATKAGSRLVFPA